MKKILIPIDGTERSKQSVELVKDYYKNEQVTIHLLSVREDYEDVRSKEDAAYMKEEVQQEVLDPIKEMLSGYVVKEDVRLGKAAEEILAYSSENQKRVGQNDRIGNYSCGKIRRMSGSDRSGKISENRK